MTADIALGKPLAAVAAGEASSDRIRHVKLSTLTLPLDTPISDAKVTSRSARSSSRWHYAQVPVALHRLHPVWSDRKVG
jgi:hypothetical protein